LKKRISKPKIAGISICLAISLLLAACSVKNKLLHGNSLLRLTDDRLYEKIYFRNLDFVESFEDEETALSNMSTERKTVYILSIFDMEIQNGGLCQFFVNSSRSLAPYVEECLETVNAGEHKKLFSEFVADNQIDLEHLESFQCNDFDEYIAQTKRYDFDAFDEAYIECAPLQDAIVSYIRTNISEF